MALAQIIDLDARRRARVASPTAAAYGQPASSPAPVWYCMWMPVYF